MNGFSFEKDLVEFNVWNMGHENSVPTIFGGWTEGEAPSVLGPQWFYIKRLTRGTRTKEMNDIWLRKRRLDVLANEGMFEKELQKTNGLCSRPVNEGKKASKAGGI